MRKRRYRVRLPLLAIAALAILVAAVACNSTGSDRKAPITIAKLAAALASHGQGHTDPMVVPEHGSNPVGDTSYIDSNGQKSASPAKLGLQATAEDDDPGPGALRLAIDQYSSDHEATVASMDPLGLAHYTDMQCGGFVLIADPANLDQARNNLDGTGLTCAVHPQTSSGSVAPPAPVQSPQVSIITPSPMPAPETTDTMPPFGTGNGNLPTGPPPTGDPNCLAARLPVQLSPSSGPNGTTVSVSGTGWDPSYNVDLTYRAADDSNDSYSTAEVFPDNHGCFSTTIVAQDPNNTPGRHVIVVESGIGSYDSADFSATP